MPGDSASPRLSSLPAVSIRLLTTADMSALYALRLDALRHHPEAFAPSYEEECAVDPEALPIDRRHSWVRNDNFVVGAFIDTALVGAVGVQRWTRQKQRHKAAVWLLYTDTRHRGQGLGKRLLLTAIDQCRHVGDLESLHLSVGGESPTAKALYTSVGFEVYGREPSALRLGARYIDVELMSLRLQAPSSHSPRS